MEIITYASASDNIVTVSISKKYGEKFTFLDFMKTGTTVTVIDLSISSIYLIVSLPHNIVNLELIDRLIIEDGEINIKDISNYRINV
ncbi:hypothetical protein DSCW_36130 [Desulfosarcina widdelii]|uniref:Uncharacterized protein n=1 Tax=Desulfosarcina widdelii TaxID=947919 RepID=A0A5K7Z378_9BACT|nr:hypothetical protein [Desulfosarcina widdelii]BBO76196.1 hypothetical protein DSCW_36130 [Desulfosarcina widdelii]